MHRVGLRLLLLAATLLGLGLRLDRLATTSNFDGSDPAVRALLGQMLASWGWPWV